MSPFLFWISENFFFSKCHSFTRRWNLSLSLYRTIPSSDDPKEEGFGKHCGKRRKCCNQHFLLFPQCFLVNQVGRWSFYQYLILYQTANFRLFLNERVCRQHFQICQKWQKSLQTSRKHCGKRKIIAHFLTVFSKDLHKFVILIAQCEVRPCEGLHWYQQVI